MRRKREEHEREKPVYHWNASYAAKPVRRKSVAEAFEAGLFYLLFHLHWVAAIVIGSWLTRYNLVERHHPLWLSLIYGFGIPLLLVVLHALFYDGSNGAKNETGCTCGIMALMLFFILVPVFMKAAEKARQHRAHHLAAPVAPGGQAVRKVRP